MSPVRGGFFALGRHTEKLFSLTCRGDESKAKEGLSWGHTKVMSFLMIASLSYS